MTFGLSCHVLYCARSPSHLIVILGDDIGWNEVSWHNPGIKTPHLQVWEGLGERGVSNCVSEACKRGRATDPVLHHAQVLPQQGRSHDRPLPLEDRDAAGSHREVQHVSVTLSQPAHFMQSCHQIPAGWSQHQPEAAALLPAGGWVRHPSCGQVASGVLPP